MKKITEILRLRAECGWSYQRIGWPLPDGVDEDRLITGQSQSEDYLSFVMEKIGAYKTDAQFDFERVLREMERKGVTLKLLWRELRGWGYPHNYSWFCRRFQ